MSEENQNQFEYTEDSIRSLDWKEHIRLRPGMYIGKLGDGSAADDGIYVLLKEVVDNCIDEHVMGHGKKIEIKLKDDHAEIRDFGRGIPLGKVIDCVSKINTGGKYDSKAFQKSVGLNGVGTKAVNALSDNFVVRSVRDGQCKEVEYKRGELLREEKVKKTEDRNGTYISFYPDASVFKNYKFDKEFVENQIWNYAYLNAGLSMWLNGQKYHSANGLKDLLERKTGAEELRYPIIHLQGEDIELALSHSNSYGEDYYTFVNGQHTTMGGTHLTYFREGIVKAVRDFFKKDYDASDIRASIAGAISVRVQEPVFESQTKTKLGSVYTSPDEKVTLRSFVVEFVSKEIEKYLHQNAEIADAMQRRIMQSERERKEMAGIKKLANQRAKKANLHNKKLRDCRVHYGDTKNEHAMESTLFITEGDSASGSITKARNVQTQAVFSLRGKPLNSFGLTKKVVYENEEFNLLQHALNIEESLDDLRYNRVVIATDADVDGMHIRLLALTFFLQFFPDLVKHGHLYILETPLFRVRSKKETIYCYTEKERVDAIEKLGKNPEITRFKGLGEISPDEFKGFINEDIRLQQVRLDEATKLKSLLEYFMGKNTPERQDFIINNLKVEKDLVEEEANG